MANHVSFADPGLVGYATPRMVRFLMWQPYHEKRLLTFFFRALHAIPIGTNSPKETIRALRDARRELEQGELVGIFPEGNISVDGELHEFERGFERVVEGTGVGTLHVLMAWAAIRLATKAAGFSRAGNACFGRQ